MLKETLRKLGPEFGFLAEDEQNEVEQNVLNRLDRSVKLDEVDTITFGLETDDGKIVKVYVKVDQADEFEKALADKLGQVDDIEEVLNELSKEYEIVDVEWPSEDTDNSDEAEDDGSDSLDSKVYDNEKEQAANGKDVKAKMEGLTVGEQFTMQINEGSNPGSIESRFTTPSQLMVYHAILELGVPELALSRSPYRSSIIKSIKAKAQELASSATMKNALKTFINRSIDYDKRAEANKKAAGGTSIGESVSLNEGATETFWATFTKLINHIAASPDDAQEFLGSNQVKQLMATSASTIPSKVSAQLAAKMKGLNDVLEAKVEKKPKLIEAYVGDTLTEGTTPEEISTLLKNMLLLADASKSGTKANAVMNSSAWNKFFTAAKSQLTQKFTGQSRSKLNSMKAAMQTGGQTVAPVGTQQAAEAASKPNAELAHAYSYGSEKFDAGKPIEVIGEEGDHYIVKPFPIMAHGNLKLPKSAVKLIGKINVPIGGPGGEMKGGLNESQVPEWTFDTEDESTIIACATLKVKLNDEEVEKLIKGITNRDAVIVRDEEDPSHKVAFSPRGSSVMVKKVGTPEGVMMKQKDVDTLLDFIGGTPANDSEDDTEKSDNAASIDAKVDNTPEKKPA
jgi:hypothetical protein